MTHDHPVKLVHITTIPMTLRFFSGQISYMQAQKISMHIITSSGTLLDEFAEKEQVQTHTVEMTRQISPLRDLLAVYRIWRQLHQIQPDIVHTHTPKGGVLGMIGAWLTRVPIRIYHIHGLLTTATGIKRCLLWASDWISCRLAHQVYCVSPSVRQIIIDKGLCSEKKISVLHHGSINGVAADTLFHPIDYVRQRKDIRSKHFIPPDAIVIGFVGRVVRDKGIIELTHAWKKIQNDYSNLHLLLVGPFEAQDPLPRDIETLLRNDECIHVIDKLIDLDEMPYYYSSIDILILPSYREGFPVAPLEASAMALPVVSTQIPGCVDSVVDGVTGTLVPVRNVEALTNAIRRYIDDPELRRTHGQAGRERVLRDFRPEDIWQALFAEYQRLLFEKGIMHRGADV